MAPESGMMREKLHVCLVSGSYPPVRCGVGDYTDCLARALANAGARVSVLTSAGSMAAPEPPGVAVYREVPAWGLASLPVLGRILKQLQPHVVHVQYPSLGYGLGLSPNILLAWLAWRQPHISRFLTLHEYAMFSWRGKTRVGPGLAAAHGVFFTNHRDRRAARRFGRIEHQRRLVVPLGSPAAREDGSPLFLDSPPAGDALIHFGTVMPNKGWEILLPALKILKEENQAWRLDVIGELLPGHYDYHAKVLKKIRVLGLGEFVRFLGYLEPGGIREAFRASSGVAVLPYTHGAQLNRSSLVTALQAGLAVVATRPSCPLEGLRHGENIWWVEPNSPRALAEGLRALRTQPELVHRLQDGAGKLAFKFAWPRIARRMLAVYHGE